MRYELIGRPSNEAEVRRDFEEFCASLESQPGHQVRVVFGFAWGNNIYKDKWIELELSGADLRKKIAEAEHKKNGRIGEDDLFVTLPDMGVERHYCHEADVHVTAQRHDHPYILAEKQKWIARGWKIYERQTKQ